MCVLLYCNKTSNFIQTQTTFSDLDKPIDIFSTNKALGQGGQGTVYKDMLLNGRIVVVKKFNVVDEKNLEQFINELVILSQIDHINIVKVLLKMLPRDWNAHSGL